MKINDIKTMKIKNMFLNHFMSDETFSLSYLYAEEQIPNSLTVK